MKRLRVIATDSPWIGCFSILHSQVAPKHFCQVALTGSPVPIYTPGWREEGKGGEGWGGGGNYVGGKCLADKELNKKRSKRSEINPGQEYHNIGKTSQLKGNFWINPRSWLHRWQMGNTDALKMASAFGRTQPIPNNLAKFPNSGKRMISNKTFNIFWSESCPKN